METSNLSTIKSWAEEDRPREKLLNKGKHTLSESELIAILLRSGSRSESAVDLAKKILNYAENDLAHLSRLSVADLSKFHGMGKVKAITLVAALELGRRRREAEAIKKEKITSSRDAAEIMQPHLSDLRHEEFWIILLDRSNTILRRQNISTGGVAGTVVDAKIIFKEALDHLASGIILCHNHPSGNKKPSEEDIRLTKKIKEGGQSLDVKLLDHLIIAGNDFFSFADEGLI